MASPLNAVVTGIGVGVVGFTQSVITDAYTNDWDLSKVRWGNAVAFGALTGAVSGVGYMFMNVGKNIVSRYSIYLQQTFPTLAIFAAFGRLFSSIVDIISSGINNILGKIFD